MPAAKSVVNACAPSGAVSRRPPAGCDPTAPRSRTARADLGWAACPAGGPTWRSSCSSLPRVLTGGVTFLVGSGPVAPVVVAHGVVGLALLVLSPWKAAVARRGLRRGRPGRGLSVALTALVLVALGSGLAHSTGIWRGTAVLGAMQVHVAARSGGGGPHRSARTAAPYPPGART